MGSLSHHGKSVGLWYDLYHRPAFSCNCQGNHGLSIEQHWQYICIFIFTWAITAMLRSKNESTSFFFFYLVAKWASWSQAFLSPVFGLQEVSKYFVNTWTHALLKILARFYKISKHTSLLENLFSDIIQEYFPSKFRLLFHIKNYQNKTNQCRVLVQQYFIEEKAPFTWL